MGSYPRRLYLGGLRDTRYSIGGSINPCSVLSLIFFFTASICLHWVHGAGCSKTVSPRFTQNHIVVFLIRGASFHYR